MHGTGRKGGAGRVAAAVVVSLLCGGALSAGAAVPGSGGVRIDGVLLPPERIWSEYRLQNSARSMIHARVGDKIDEPLLASVVEQSVNVELLDREVSRRGIAFDAAERAALRADEVKGWRGEEQFRSALAMLKVDEAFILSRATRARLLARMATRDSGADRGIAAADLQDFYGKNLNRYLPKELPPVRYLFVPAGGPDLSSVFAAIVGEVNALREAGKSYEPVVRKWSKHESAARAGLVPEREAGSVASLPFQPAAADLKECRITRERRDAGGLHVYLRDCRQPRPFAAVKEQVTSELIAERRQAWIAGLLARLKAQAKIEYLEADPPPQPPGAHPAK